MARVILDLDTAEFEALHARMVEFGAGSWQIVDNVLHGEGAELIKQNIRFLLPKSGRDWRGKPAPASSAGNKLFRQVNKPLEVKVKTAYAYNYLYFPDDGSNTRHHVGDQQFFMRGGEKATDDIIALCINALIKRME